jgi:hypothetical protein
MELPPKWFTQALSPDPVIETLHHHQNKYVVHCDILQVHIQLDGCSSPAMDLVLQFALEQFLLIYRVICNNTIDRTFQVCICSSICNQPPEGHFLELHSLPAHGANWPHSLGKHTNTEILHVYSLANT